MLYYFGGKFNPWTRGHYKVLDALCEHIQTSGCWKEGDQILIGVTEVRDDTGIKGHHLCSSEEYRMDLIRPSLRELESKYSFLKEHPGMFLTFQDTPYTYEFLKGYCEKHCIETWKNNDITLVLGDDEFNDLCESSSSNKDEFGRSLTAAVKKWKYADELLRMKAFVVKRVGISDIVSSTRVRDIFYRNPYTSYDDVKDYLSKSVFDNIKSWHYYWQQGYEDEYRKEETVYLKGYDAGKYPRPSATVDMIVVMQSIIGKGSDKVLLIRRKNFPFKGFWALPGGFLDINDDLTLEEAAERELMEETEIHWQFKPCDQFRTYSDMGTDPRCRVVDTVYAVKGPDWYVKAGDDAAELDWFDIDKLPRMAFNHRQIIEDYLHSSKYKETEPELAEECDNDVVI